MGRSAVLQRKDHPPEYDGRRSAADRVEEIFGWTKTVGGFRRTRHHGVDRTGLAGYLVAAAYNLVRMAKLLLRRKDAAVAPAA